MFGQPETNIYQVHELTLEIRDTLEQSFGDVWVEGELSNVRRHSSGHLYFTLKDADAQLSGVMWRGFSRYLFFEPQDGMLVRAHGQISVYERRGTYQLIARSLRPAGEGALQQAFEALKARLDDEGLFDSVHKQALPRFPQTIGVITSGDGAALRDVLTVLSRRYPLVHVLICPVRVQGPGAAEQIAEAVEAFNTLDGLDIPRPDVLIVGRGGGSIEDLWAFNEERVARALFASRIPTISAVGHETDFTISDFVADVRAATPSIAAELAVPDGQELDLLLRGTAYRLHELMTTRLDHHRRRIESLTNSRAFHRPVDRVREARLGIEALKRQLEALNPEAPLRRGYVRVTREGQVVNRAQGLHSGDSVKLHFRDGQRAATIID